MQETVARDAARCSSSGLAAFSQEFDATSFEWDPEFFSCFCATVQDAIGCCL